MLLSKKILGQFSLIATDYEKDLTKPQMIALYNQSKEDQHSNF
jgi:hypothetical protein